MTESTPKPAASSLSLHRTRWQRYLPILAWLPGYQRSWLRLDLLAGLTILGTTVPTAMGYAAVAGLPPQAGLYASMMGLFAYAIFGTSRQLKVEASPSMAIMTAAIVGPLAISGSAYYMALAAALGLIVGAILVVAGAARMGYLADFLARPVVTGYLFGLALTIAMAVSPKLVGLPPAGPGDFLPQVRALASGSMQVNGWTIAISLGAFGVILLLRRFAPRLPGALVLVLLGIALVSVFNLTEKGVAVVGPIPNGLPSLQVPWIHLTDLVILLVGGAGMVFLALAESLGSARAVRFERRERIDPDQELIALGIANVSAGLFQGLAVDANLATSATASSVGSRSQLSSLITAASLLLVLILPGQFLSNVPSAILAVAVIMSVVRFMDVQELRRLYRSRLTDFVLALAALVGVITAGVLGGLLLAVFLSLAIVLYRASRPHIALLGKVLGHQAYGDLARSPDALQVPGLLIVRPDVQLFFANANAVGSQIVRLVGEHPQPVSTVLIDLGASADIDVASLDMLSDLIDDLGDVGVRVLLAEVAEKTVDRLQRAGLLARLGEEHVYLDVVEAVEDFTRTPETRQSETSVKEQEPDRP